MDFETLYRERLTDAASAAAMIPSGAKVAMALGVGQPPALLAAIAARAEAGTFEAISLYYMLSTAIAGKTVLRPELNGRIRPYSLFHSGVERALEDAGCTVEFISSSFQQVPRVLTHEVGVDTLVATVSSMDAEGNFSFGTNPDYSVAVANTAKRVILEVNPNMPHTGGRSTIHVSRVTAIVEHDVPLLAVPEVAPRAEDRAIGGYIAEMVRDGATLQMGIGALPNAVCEALAGHCDLGVHTEMFTPGLARLMQKGIVTNARKAIHTGETVFAFAMGDVDTYRFIDRNPAAAAYPVDYVNDPYVIAQNPGMVSVNATLQVDLMGACCSEYLGGRQYTGSGGQLDFVRGAVASEGGRSIIACHATAAKGTLSRIVPRLDGPVTTPRNDVQYIATEFGVAELKGKSMSERARALIAIAAPQFRDELTSQAKELGLI